MATDASNARRRERYANDPVFRARILKQNRESPCRTDYDPHRAWVKQLKRLYGMTAEAYYSLLEAQHGVCRLCEQSCSDGKRLAVDHDHDTGRIRGLLCRRCNTGIGMLRHDVAILERAQEYLS